MVIVLVSSICVCYELLSCNKGLIFLGENVYNGDDGWSFFHKDPISVN